MEKPLHKIAILILEGFIRARFRRTVGLTPSEYRRRFTLASAAE